jgi:hypothetical protein
MELIFSLQFLLELARKEHDIEDDDIKIALMVPAFTFDPVTHATWSDVSSSEIAAGFGYTAGGESLTTVAAAINTTDSRVDISADTVTWTADGGTIPEAGSVIFYNNTHASKTVVGCVDFGDGVTYETADGKLLQAKLSSGFMYLRTVPSS